MNSISKSKTAIFILCFQKMYLLMYFKKIILTVTINYHVYILTGLESSFFKYIKPFLSSYPRNTFLILRTVCFVLYSWLYCILQCQSISAEVSDYVYKGNKSSTSILNSKEWRFLTMVCKFQQNNVLGCGFCAWGDRKVTVCLPW